MKHWTLFFSAIALSACSLTVPVAATSNPVGTKMGRSSGVCFLGVCLNVDASVMTAAQNGSITKISTVDYKKKNYFGIVQVHECLVSGE